MLAGLLGTSSGATNAKGQSLLPDFVRFHGSAGLACLLVSLLFTLGKRKHTPPCSSEELLFAEKLGVTEERFGGRYGFPGFDRVLVSTAGLEIFSLRPEKFSKRFSFVGSSVRFLLLCHQPLSGRFVSTLGSLAPLGGGGVCRESLCIQGMSTLMVPRQGLGKRTLTCHRACPVALSSQDLSFKELLPKKHG